MYFQKLQACVNRTASARLSPISLSMWSLNESNWRWWSFIVLHSPYRLIACLIPPVIGLMNRHGLWMMSSIWSFFGWHWQSWEIIIFNLLWWNGFWDVKTIRKKYWLIKRIVFILNINIIDRIFPNAKWIHIVRDGRDVTLSINKEWNKRKQIVKERNIHQLIHTTMNMLKRQPFLKYRVMAVLFELFSNSSLN